MAEEAPPRSSVAGAFPRARVRGAVVCVAVAIGLLLVAVPPVLARESHVLAGTFGSVSQPSFVTPEALAVDPATGDLLVLDIGTASVSRFKPNGEPAPFAGLGTNVIDAKKGPGGKVCASEPASCDETPQNGLVYETFAGHSKSNIAVAPPGAVAGTAGDIYVTQGTKRLVDVFSAEGRYLGQITKAGPLKLGPVTSVAVDPAGDVYLYDNSEAAVYKYAPSANPPLSTDLIATFNEELSVSFGGPRDVLAAGAGPTAGSLFALCSGLACSFGPEGPTGFQGAAFVKWDAASGAPIALGGTIQHSLTVDPVSGHVFTFGPGGTLFEFDASSNSQRATLLTDTEVGFPISGAAVDGPTGDIYISQENGQIKVYGPAITIFPDATVEATSAITATSATLNGTVNPDGEALTECFFEWGETTAYDHTAPCDKTPAEIGAGSSPVAVHAALTGLQPDKEYSFRLAATNAEHNTTRSEGGYSESERHFVTSGPAVTGPASEVNGSTATLNAEVDPSGSELEECFFEWGETTAYGHTAACEETPAEIGSGSSFVAVHADVSGLIPNGSEYHFRVVAKSPSPPSGYGTFAGKDRSFVATSSSSFTIESGAASELGASTATLSGTVNPGGQALTECAFEWGPTESYGHSEPCEESLGAIGSGVVPVPVQLKLSGLEVGGEYHFRLIAADAGGSGRGKDVAFRVLGPSIEEQWSVEVVHSEATVNAEINPGATATTFAVEYGETAAYGQSTPRSGAGSGSSPHTVSALLEGLRPGVTYHYRFTASSDCEAAHPANECTVLGRDHTFATYPVVVAFGACPNQAFRVGASAGLPDCRAYEMVSPVDKNGVNIQAGGATSEFRYAFEQAAADGEAITYSANAAFAGEPSAANSNQYLATRTPSGWATRGINPPLDAGSSVENCLFYLETPFEAFSEDLSSAWLRNLNLAPLARDAAQQGAENLYRTDTLSGGYEALTRGEPSHLPPDGCNEEVTSPDVSSPEFRGASADRSEQFFDAEGKFTSDAAETSNRQVYDSAGGTLHLLSVLPDGSAAATPSAVGSGPAVSLPTNYPPGEFARTESVTGAVSADGARVYWSSATGPGSARTLFLRTNPSQPESSAKDGAGNCRPEAAKACTIAVSGAGEVVFWAADPAGPQALYSEGDPSTSAATLYQFDAETGVSTPIAAESSGVLGASTDLSYVYFVSREDLAAGATAAQNNLYLDHDGAFTFIADLSARDVYAPNSSEEIYTSAVAPSPFYRDTRVSPDGRHLAFMSSRPLTGADNTDQQTREPDSEVYLYEAGGQLRCVSCNPSGARPAGKLLFPPFGAGQAAHTENVRVAAWIPSFEHELQGARLLSPDGTRVFFDSFDALLPTDTNGVQDVYEWEAPGTGGAGGCHLEDADYFAADGGCLSLISSGESPQESEFIDAGDGGRDVFIRTASSFMPRDQGLLDIYDAREGGGEAEPTPPAACEGEACQSPPEPPNDPTPASSIFEGAGNLIPPLPVAPVTPVKPKPLTRAQKLAKALKACHAKPKRKRKPCEKQARKRYATKARPHKRSK